MEHLTRKYYSNINIKPCFMDSNNLSIGNHFFKVLVQIHYSLSPARPKKINFQKEIFNNITPFSSNFLPFFIFGNWHFLLSKSPSEAQKTLLETKIYNNLFKKKNQ